jgi:hypothetical protein
MDCGRRAAARRLRQRPDHALKLLIAAWLAFALPLHARAQALEHEVKAAYIYRFLSFVEWPADAEPKAKAPFVIGVDGADDVQSQLEEIAKDRRVGAHPLEVRRLRDVKNLRELQVLFVGQRAAALLPKLRGIRGLLVVSDADDALNAGATIALVRREERVRFSVALDDAEERGLRMSSRMLSVAEYVRGGKP